MNFPWKFYIKYLTTKHWICNLIIDKRLFELDNNKTSKDVDKMKNDNLT